MQALSQGSKCITSVNMPLSKLDDTAMLIMKKENNTEALLGRETGNSHSKGHGYKDDRSGDLNAINFENSISLTLYIGNVQGMTFILIFWGRVAFIFKLGERFKFI